MLKAFTLLMSVLLVVQPLAAGTPIAYQTKRYQQEKSRSYIGSLYDSIKRKIYRVKKWFTRNKEDIKKVVDYTAYAVTAAVMFYCGVRLVSWFSDPFNRQLQVGSLDTKAVMTPDGEITQIKSAEQGRIDCGAYATKNTIGIMRGLNNQADANDIITSSGPRLPQRTAREWRHVNGLTKDDIDAIITYEQQRGALQGLQGSVEVIEAVDHMLEREFYLDHNGNMQIDANGNVILPIMDRLQQELQATNGQFYAKGFVVNTADTNNVHLMHNMRHASHEEGTFNPMHHWVSVVAYRNPNEPVRFIVADSTNRLRITPNSAVMRFINLFKYHVLGDQTLQDTWAHYIQQRDQAGLAVQEKMNALQSK